MGTDQVNDTTSERGSAGAGEPRETAEGHSATSESQAAASERPTRRMPRPTYLEPETPMPPSARLPRPAVEPDAPEPPSA